MKKLFTLLCIFALSINSLSATDYTVEPTTAIQAKSLPVYMSDASNTTSYITQQIFWPSLLKDAGDNAAPAGNITAVSFYYAAGSNNVDAFTRDIQIWLMDTTISSYKLVRQTVGYSTVYSPEFLCDSKNKAGKLVYEGKLRTKAKNTGDPIDTVKLVFQNPFQWDGTSNIVMTVFDVTKTSIGTNAYNNLKFYITEVSPAQAVFANKYWNNGGDDVTTWRDDFHNRYSDGYGSSKNDSTTQAGKRKYVPKTTFSIEPAPDPEVPATPEDLAVSNVGSTTADLSWTAVDGADSYKLLYSTDGTVFVQFATPSTNSYSWSGLTANTTYYVQVAAVNAAGTGEYSEAESFTTLAPHIHDGITFEPWFNASAMPTSGNYYLETDVAFNIYNSDVTLTGNLNLCLNGHTANLFGSKIVVPEDKTLTIYDNVGGGKITGFVASEVGAADIYAKALIAVYSGGTLILKEGTIENAYVPDNDGRSYAIYSNGTIHLSGDVLINSGNADIYLYNSNIITLDGAISNAEKHSVWKNDGAFTSGWTTYMSGADPRDYFESANSARSVYYNGSEAALRLNLNLSESSNNSAIATYAGELIDVNLTRSLTSAQYNTFCLPFALTNTELQTAFGVGYDLQEFVSSDLVDETLELTFNKVNALEAGKPYLLKPSVDVVNPIFLDVIITETTPNDQTSDPYISFYGIYRPTELEGGNKNILFLGAENELFWPETSGNLKGFRAYFEVKGGAAKIAKRARIINKDESTTGLGEVQGNKVQGTKYIENGQLFILYNGAKYNVQGGKVMNND